MSDAVVLVVGVGWSRQGWVGVALDPSTGPGVFLERDLSDLIDRTPAVSRIAIDMPIGLPAVERTCDLLAREYVGVRRSSVFMTPPQVVFDAPTYVEANAIAVSVLSGKKITRQAWALRRSMKHVKECADRDARIIEVHPEVSFRAMVARELKYSKNSWNGQALRRRALAEQGIVLRDELSEKVGAVPVADVLDAAAAAWSARRFVSGNASSLPKEAHPSARSHLVLIFGSTRPTA